MFERKAEAIINIESFGSKNEKFIGVVPRYKDLNF